MLRALGAALQSSAASLSAGPPLVGSQIFFVLLGKSAEPEYRA